jgi:hypothetical protein
MTERALSETLHDLVRDPVVPHDLPRRVVRAHRRRRHAMVAVSVATLAAATFATAVVARPPADRAAGPATPRVVGGTGFVVAKAGEPVRFCRWATSGEGGVRDALAGSRGSREPGGEPRCEELGVVVEGADLDALDHRTVVGSTVAGEARLEGVLEGGTLTVTRQAPPDPRPVEESVTDEPLPCPAPPGGWPPDSTLPRGMDAIHGQSALDVVARRYPDNVLLVLDGAAWTPNLTVYVVVAVDPDLVAAEMRATVGDRICFVRSRYTRDQIYGTLADLERRRDRRDLVIEPGTGLTSDRQFVVYAVVVAHDDAVERLVREYPPGLVEVRPWLEPVG